MIVGDGGRGPTLDDLFRRAGVRRPQALALADPADRARIAGGAPRRLTYSEADRAISAFAATLRGLGLHADTVVGLHLPNTVESAVALLGTLRAGMIAAPLPLLWRERDLIDALGRAGAKVLVTAGRIGAVPHAEIAMQVAAELFPIRYVCAFGADGADGIVPLDAIFAANAAAAAPALQREQPGAHAAVITFDTTRDGIALVLRSHAQLVAAGARLAAECGLAQDGAILSAVPPASFAGIACALVPWLIGGGSLHLHHAFAPDVFAAQCAGLDGGAVVVPATVVPAIAPLLAHAGSVVALWRTPERMQFAPPQAGGVIDVACFGEHGLLLSQRDANGAILPLPFNGDTQRLRHGALALRASGVELSIFPPADGAPEQDEFADTGFACQADPERGTLSITAGPAGLVSIGGYRFARGELDALVADAAPDAGLFAVPHALLGERLAGSAPDPAAVAEELAAAGLNPLIASAFRARTRAAG